MSMFWLNFKLILAYGLMLIALSGIAYVCVEYILPYMIKKAKEKEQRARLQDKEALRQRLTVSSVYDNTGRKVG